jgi:hypothetical protein
MLYEPRYVRPQGWGGVGRGFPPGRPVRDNKRFPLRRVAGRRWDVGSPCHAAFVCGRAFVFLSHFDSRKPFPPSHVVMHFWSAISQSPTASLPDVSISLLLMPCHRLHCSAALLVGPHAARRSCPAPMWNSPRPTPSSCAWHWGCSSSESRRWPRRPSRYGLLAGAGGGRG